MAGIYIHIPFCKSKCIYCDFYSGANINLKSEYVDALCHEVRLRESYLYGETIDTIYFGGGTPSLLSDSDFQKIFTTLHSYFDLSFCKEITLEANPDDITDEYVSMLTTLPFNRVSLGCQSFDDKILTFLGRRHDSKRAEEAVRILQDRGFDNISIDLIYGYPQETQQQWEDDLQKAISLDVPHISAYHLIYEQGTPLHTMLMRGKVSEIDEERSLLFFSMLLERLSNAGFEQYEISNFCKDNRYSRHNSSYWKGIKYLGLGAAAHSYDGISRQWNIADTNKYIKGIYSEPQIEKEILTDIDRYNEYIITKLRTKWGIALDEMEEQFGKQKVINFQDSIQPFLNKDLLQLNDGIITLTKSGIFLSDSIMSDLMIV